MIHPLRDRIIVRQDPIREDVSTAGILIAASTKIVESQRQFGRLGTVVACGQDVDRDQLRPGDRVLYGEFDWPTVEDPDDQQLYVVLQDADITGVITAH